MTAARNRSVSLDGKITQDRELVFVPGTKALVREQLNRRFDKS